MVEIRIAGPGKNALGTELIANLTAQIEAANGAPLLFTGEGDAFSAGLNLKEVASLDADGMDAFLDRLETFFRLIWLYPGPTAAAVNGHAIAGGCIVAMCCDHSVATDNPKARIGLNEVGIGLRFPPGILNFVRATINPQHQSEVVLGAGLHSPVEALRLGLVAAVDADPVEAARASLKARAKHPKEAYSTTKLDMRSGIMDATPAQKKSFKDEVVPFWTSPELKAMIRALLGG
jgi:enoyl-CoA hydratase/carnithine racemase